MTRIPLVLLLLAGVPSAQKLASSGRPAPATAPLHLEASMDLGAELAGVRCPEYPHFTYVRAFNAGDPVEVAVDTGRMPDLGGRTVDLWVTRHRTPDEWAADPTLVDAGGGPRSVTLTALSVKDNVFQVNPGTLAGWSGTHVVGVGYDVVVDYNRNGRLDFADKIDGWDGQPGFTVMPDLTRDGPYSPRSFLHNGGSFLRKKVYYPDEISGLGKLPLVVISHGNGHNYLWYDHLGEFLASWGYVVMSHENNTGPGIESASTTTLRNTNNFLTLRNVLSGGVLKGHVDADTIVWIGHSRGGEGVVRAYQRVLAGDPLAKKFSASDIKLVSSIAPTDFLGPGVTEPGDVVYHLWTGGADADVNGCANCDICQTFHLHERATGTRLSTSLHGVGHGDFHDGGGSSVATGPCKVGRSRTHRIMKGYLLPMLAHFIRGNEACEDYLWRQWESFRPSGAPTMQCVVVDLMYQEATGPEDFVLDDFETKHLTTVSSSGGRVATDVTKLIEGRYDDRDASFRSLNTDQYNGMTLAGPGDSSYGSIVRWNAGSEGRYLLFEVKEGMGDFTAHDFLSFRAAQTTRHPLTDLELGDLTFSVQLWDAFGNSSTISIGTYGGGIEEPYQRRFCGSGVGWANEFETVRIPLRDFTAGGRALALDSIAGVAFLFGGRFGSDFGRIGLDEIELTSE
jgi:hypothetical protein